MNNRPYHAMPDELRAIDEALVQEAIPEAELPAYCRREAQRLRSDADQAETVELGVKFLDMAERFARFSEIYGG